MDFSEKTKLEVKHKAMFQCCRCKVCGVDIHNITPIKDGGTKDISNAAPLCQNCHDQLGDNPSKRKEIKQMRDHWYKIVENMYSNKTDSLLPLIEKISDSLTDIQTLVNAAKYWMEHFDSLLLETKNQLHKATLFGKIFEELPTFQELKDGTPKLSSLFELNKDFNSTQNQLCGA